MTLQQMTEEVLFQFPKASGTYVALKLNEALQSFVLTTKCLISEIDMDLDANVWPQVLPMEIESVLKMVFFDKDGEEITDPQFNYAVVDRVLELYTLDGAKALGTTFPSDLKSVRFRCVFTQVALTELTDFPLIREDFHPALVYRVIQELAASAGDYNKSHEYERMYKLKEREAKIYARRGGDSGAWRMRYEDF